MFAGAKRLYGTVGNKVFALIGKRNGDDIYRELNKASLNGAFGAHATSGIFKRSSR